MHVFLTGATGLIGSAVLTRLVKEGHLVTGMTHSPSKVDELRAAGAEPLVADLADPGSYRDAVRAADATVHAGATSDARRGAVDRNFVETAIDALSGTGKTFIYTGGIWDYGSSEDITEESPSAPIPMIAWRPAVTELVRTAPGLRGIVIAPAMVHRPGTGLHTVLAAARTEGDEPAVRLAGSGQQHWTMVHADDLAELYALALAHPDAGGTILAAANDNPTVYDLGVALSHSAGLDGRVAIESEKDTRARFGPLADALLLDQRARGEHARALLGWTPSRPTVIDTVTEG